MLETTKEQLRQEGIEYDTKGLVFVSKIKAVNGSIILTAKRLAFFSSGNPLAGWLFKLIFKKLGPHVCLSLPIEEIASVEPSQKGINKKVFEVILTQGKSYKFVCNNKETVDQWVATLTLKMKQ
jgi:hypothetical protein